MKTWEISFQKGGVYQINLVDADTAEQALFYFIDSKPGCEVIGIHENRSGEKPGIPHMTAAGELQVKEKIFSDMMAEHTDTVIEATWICHDLWQQGFLDVIPFWELKEILTDATVKFDIENINTDWREHDFREEIDLFIKKELAAALWERFGDVPMDPETEEIEQNWNIFTAGTHREDIWHWFEDTFDVSVAEDLMHVGDKEENEEETER